MQEPFLIKYSKIITIFSLAGIGFCILLILFTFLHREFSKKTYLSVQLAPSSAVLTLDNSNQELRTGTYELQPGHYSGVISANSFTPKTIEFDVKPRQSNSLNEYLVHTKEGLKYFEKSSAYISILRQIQNDQDITDFLEAYDYNSSIYEQLPFYSTWLKRPDDYPTYTLSITDGRNNPNCQGTLCLLAIGPMYNENEISKTLSEKGFFAENYEVLYEKSY